MKKHFKTLLIAGLVVIGLVLCSAVVFAIAPAAQSAHQPLAPLAPLGALSFLPFAMGAVKVRDDMHKTRTVKYINTGTATTKDTVYLINGIPMLALDTALISATNIYLVEGLIEYAKLSAQAWTAGEKVYWDNGNSRFTTVSSGNTLAGIAAEPAANPSSTGLIILTPFMVGTNQLESTITDPGNAGAIPVTGSGVCAMTSAGAETRTLAIPTYIGQTIALIDDTHVGNIVITASQAINQAGNTIMTFGAAADAIYLVAMTVGGALRWRVVGNDGVALS